MTSDRPFGNAVATSPWLLAILVGFLLTVYLTVQQWHSPGNHQLGILIPAGLLLGYAYSTRDASTYTSGLIAGILASLPVVWSVLAMLRYIPGFDQPLWFGAVQAVVVLQVVALLTLFVVATTVGSTLLGAWIGAKIKVRPSTSAT